MFLPDVQVLLALVFEAHQHHVVARTWVEDVHEAGACRVCRVTQSGLLRLSSNPALFADEALSLSQAWNAYETLMEDDRFAFSPEPLGLEHLWRRLSATEAYSPKGWTDRYLAAFAVAGDLALVTLDKALGTASGGSELDELGLRVELLN